MTAPTRFRAAVLVVPFAVGAMLRLARVESSPYLILVNAIIPIVLIGTFVPLTVAAARRAWATVAVGILVLSAGLYWLRLDVGLAGSVDAGAQDDAALTIVSANVKLDNPTLPATLAELVEQDPDIIALQEFTPAHSNELAASEVLAGYPYRVVDPQEGAHGSAILSRLPVTEGRRIMVAGWPMTEALVDVDGRSLRIVNVHTSAPLSGENIERWHDQFDRLAEIAGEAAAAGTALVLVGDFNATGQSHGASVLEAAGLRDAHLASGRGLGATFPADRRWPPVLRLDWALSSPEVRPLGLRTLPLTGTDHRGLVVGLAFTDG